MSKTYQIRYPLPGGTPHQTIDGLMTLRQARKIGFEHAQGQHGCPWLRSQCRAVEIVDQDGGHKEWC